MTTHKKRKKEQRETFGFEHLEKGDDSKTLIGVKETPTERKHPANAGPGNHREHIRQREKISVNPLSSVSL